jgi:hypothetical protein
MTTNRARQDLDHATERLLASRAKAKRQYFIQRIGELWKTAHSHCCLVFARTKHIHHHPPTTESIAAVASFANDPSSYVRLAVASTLAAHEDAMHGSNNALIQLLQDKSPPVRITVAEAVYRNRLAYQLPNQLVTSLLADEVWSVRWPIAASLAGMERHLDGWKTMCNSIPRNMPFLDYWAIYAIPFTDDVSQDKQVHAILRNRLRNCAADGSSTNEFRRLLAKCNRN